MKAELNKTDKHDFLCLVDSIDSVQETLSNGFDRLDEKFEDIAESLSLIRDVFNNRLL
jgi:hypothetical protein